MIKLDVSDSSDGLLISQLRSSFYSETEISKSESEIEFLSVIREANGKLFSRCWKKANEEAKLHKLCFVEIHECFAGYDSEIGIRLEENEVDKKVANWLEQHYKDL